METKPDSSPYRHSGGPTLPPGPLPLFKPSPLVAHTTNGHGTWERAPAPAGSPRPGPPPQIIIIDTFNPPPAPPPRLAAIQHPSSAEPGPASAPGSPAAAAAAAAPKLHHLTRHWLAPEARGVSVLDALGASSTKVAEHMIRGMSQRELRAAFTGVYGTHTNSFNNNWLRRKLYEAVGVTGGAARKTRRVGRDAAARRKEQRRAAAAAAEAEALEALAEIAAGPDKGPSPKRAKKQISIEENEEIDDEEVEDATTVDGAESSSDQ